MPSATRATPRSSSLRRSRAELRSPRARSPGTSRSTPPRAPKATRPLDRRLKLIAELGQEDIPVHAARMIRTACALGARRDLKHLRLRACADVLGLRSRFSTKTRYSVTLGALRAARRAWRTEQASAQASLPEPDPTTTLVIGHWAYRGSGYSPSAGLLAAAVWHRSELERQFVAEEGC
ncbi:replication initiator [Streptomyces goshikiensis]|uniref:replication initiator n=1 Tax=Streptomyces goshikiensis TaxID=1942 RepID=UPI0036B241BE